MVLSAANSLVEVLCIGLIGCAIARAECPIYTVVLKGRVEHASRDAKVRVQLLYPKGLPGESGETSVQNGTFSIPIEFLTLSKRPMLRNLPERCDRKPRAVSITLVDTDQQYDPVSLDFAQDFRMADPSAYTLRSELVLKGKR